jgi:hypothetical protein
MGTHHCSLGGKAPRYGTSIQLIQGCVGICGECFAVPVATGRGLSRRRIVSTRLPIGTLETQQPIFGVRLLGLIIPNPYEYDYSY